MISLYYPHAWPNNTVHYRAGSIAPEQITATQTGLEMQKSLLCHCSSVA